VAGPAARISCWFLLLWLCLGPAAARAAQTLDVTQAVAVRSTVLLPSQVDFSAGEPVTLPDNWRRDRPSFAGVVWYRIPLDEALQATGAVVGQDPLVLVVPRLADAGTMWLNGERLDMGVAGGPTRNRPLWVPLPRGALRAADNVLHVRVQGDAATRGGLAVMRLGPPAALRTAYDLRWFLQAGVPLMLTFAVLLCFFAAVPLWLKTRQRAVRLFTAMCLAWLPRALVVLIPTADGPTALGLFIALASTLVADVFVLLLVLELSSWTGPFWKGFVRVVWSITGAMLAAGLLLLLRGQLQPVEAMLLHAPFYLAMLVPLAWQWRLAWRVRGRSDIFMSVSLTVWLAFVVHDMAVAGGLLPLESFFLAPLPALLVLLSLVWRTLEKMALERASAQHEIRLAVADASTAHGHAMQRLRAEFDQAKETERQAVISAERSRLLHDLHDGMGSHLITALRMIRRDGVPREDVAKVIEESLEDIRLIIDSLDLQERDLLPLLGSLRYRLEPRLNAIGVALQWDIETLPELDYLSPETGLNIVRIVQEAVNNAVRHGEARTITVRARPAADAVELSVADDGRGFDVSRVPTPGTPKRGLHAMRARAARLGGALAIESGAAGTRVALRLPLER